MCVCVRVCVVSFVRRAIDGGGQCTRSTWVSRPDLFRRLCDGRLSETRAEQRDRYTE